MEERTEIEKNTFGKIQKDQGLIKLIDDDHNEKSNQNINDDENEEELEKMIKIYLDKLQEPNDLLNQCVQRSRDNYQREYAKLKAFQIQSKFYTDEGVKDR